MLTQLQVCQPRRDGGLAPWMGGGPGSASPCQDQWVTQHRKVQPTLDYQQLVSKEHSSYQSQGRREASLSAQAIALRGFHQRHVGRPSGSILQSTVSSSQAVFLPASVLRPSLPVLVRGGRGNAASPIECNTTPAAANVHPTGSQGGAGQLQHSRNSVARSEGVISSGMVCSTAQTEGHSSAIWQESRVEERTSAANGAMRVHLGSWPLLGRGIVCITAAMPLDRRRTVMDSMRDAWGQDRQLQPHFAARFRADNIDRCQLGQCVAAHQPLEPHNVHRLYGGVRKRTEAALGELGPPTPGPSGDIVDGHRTGKLLLCGGLAGAVSRTITAPVDRLKFLMQVNSASHLTVREGLALMAQENTIKSYFRGNGANVAKNVPETAMKLTCNDRIKAMVVRDGHNITLGERLVVGAVSGGFAQAVIYPLEVIQTRLAATHGVYSGIFDVVGSVWRKEGALAFYRGITPCMLGILPYAGLDITAFELMKERLGEHYQGLPPPPVLLASGMLSSAGAMVLAYPLGFIRTRMQMDGRGGAPRQYRTMFDCLRHVVVGEGWRGLYKGFGMSLAKIAPAAGISWFIYEESKAFLQCDGEDTQSR